MIARLFGFPTKGGTVPVTVEFAPDAKGETWTRNFGGQILRSHQSVGAGKEAYLLLERFGPITVAMGLDIRDDKMHLIPRHWRLFGIPLPRFLLPKGETFETERDGRFNFHVDIVAPIIGRIVRYQGWLTRD